jgi:hypothetical protein
MALLMWICLSSIECWPFLDLQTWFFCGAISMALSSPRMAGPSSKQGLPLNALGVMREMDFTTGLGFAHTSLHVAPT